MRISVIGTGHVGLVTAACLAHVGHEILGVDADQAKIDTILSGESPFEETGLTDLLREGLENGRLRFTTDAAEAASFGPLSFVCVGTPSKAVRAAARGSRTRT